MPKPLTIVYNYKKILRRINKKFGLSITFVQFRILLYLRHNGPTNISFFYQFSTYKSTKAEHIPNLLNCGFITIAEVTDNHKIISITTEGEMWLDYYENKLHICRNDRII